MPVLSVRISEEEETSLKRRCPGKRDRSRLVRQMLFGKKHVHDLPFRLQAAIRALAAVKKTLDRNRQAELEKVSEQLWEIVREAL